MSPAWLQQLSFAVNRPISENSKRQVVLAASCVTVSLFRDSHKTTDPTNFVDLTAGDSSGDETPVKDNDFDKHIDRRLKQRKFRHESDGLQSLSERE